MYLEALLYLSLNAQPEIQILNRLASGLKAWIPTLFCRVHNRKWIDTTYKTFISKEFQGLYMDF